MNWEHVFLVLRGRSSSSAKLSDISFAGLGKQPYVIRLLLLDEKPQQAEV